MQVEGTVNVLQRFINNPVIKPKNENFWESQATFNAGAIFLDNKVHLLYRAIGADGISVLGYASSTDGKNINERLDCPVYSPRNLYEIKQKCSQDITIRFMSGGGYGGCEDPRLTKIDDKIYMTYTAFNGCNPPAVALTYIKEKDFLEKRWNWKIPKIISNPTQVHKNWVIFPEKINGKYAILHSISPDILIEFLDDLEFENRTRIESFHNFGSRENGWDNMVRGAGPSPIKTEDGWLIIYHAMSGSDPSKYKIGALLLDYNDPFKISHRLSYPILEPSARYENEGCKPGIIYSCGAVVINDQLFVYYGGADTVT
ncbi:hypothetical protein K9L05_02240, partial [Candidatus Babeliales bacterium]|nr:hypothetical protein [Candidatus Babeliales bacterium]